MTSKHANAQVLISKGVFDSIKSFDEFERRVTDLFGVNTKAQGDAFEIFVEAYLHTQPIIQCQESWLVGDIPVSIREALNLPRDSKGIDGVYRSSGDDYVPYQVKFRSNRPNLGFNEVAPFLGVTEKAIDRLLITNCDTISIDVKNRTGIRSLRGTDFDALREEDFLIMECWLKKRPTRRQPVKPYSHQVEALSNIAKHLEVNARGSVVMACGTGKTLVALWAVEQFKATSILVLVPSLMLLQQTLDEWSIHNSWGTNFSYLCVCSDAKIDLNNDEIEIDPTEVPFRVDTDPAIVRKYLLQNSGKVKVVFSTYQSGHVVKKAIRDDFEFDIGIFDEAHKTTGSADGRFALALKDENIRIRKRLFFTATPKHYDITKRDEAGELEFVSMNDDSVYGGRAHTLTFGEAASRGIICPYKVVITVIDKRQVNDFALKHGITLIDGDLIKAKWVANQIAVSVAIERTGSKRIITFHSRVKTAREFASADVPGIGRFIDGFEIFHVHGKQKGCERKDIISKFRNAPKSLITNARCLTEGVDVPAVDMVVFVDPRHSKIDIAQAVGRAMRRPKDGSKELGYIVVPVFAENSSGESLAHAIETEDFDDVAIVLNSLLEQDEDFNETIKQIAIRQGRTVSPKIEHFGNRIEVIGPSVSTELLASSISTVIMRRFGSTWFEWYGRLQSFARKYGNANVSHNYVTGTGFNLGNWVQQQRKLKGILNEEKTKYLESLSGWTWNAHDEKWNTVYAALQKICIANSSCDLPVGYVDKMSSVNLYGWMNLQRAKRNTLSSDRLQQLEALNGWTWNTRDTKWESGFNALTKYVDLKGDSLVPASYSDPEDDFKLGSWVARQRTRKSLLSAELVSRLSNVSGWSWNTKVDSSRKVFRPSISSAIGWYRNSELVIHLPSKAAFKFKKISHSSFYWLYNSEFVLFKIDGGFVAEVRIQNGTGLVRCYKCGRDNLLTPSAGVEMQCQKCNSDLNFFTSLWT